MMRNTFSPAGNPAPRGPYSTVVRIGNHIAVSGQLGLDEEGNLSDNFTDQMHLAMANLLRALESAGAGEDDVLQVNLFLTYREDFAEMNAIYREIFSDPMPARTTIQTGLSAGVLFEVDAIAVVDGSQPG